MNKEQAAWGRLMESAPRGRYEHIRPWQKRNARRANFRARVSRQPNGCWLWTGRSVIRNGKAYPMWSVKADGQHTHKSAFVWMMKEFFPEVAATLPRRTSTTCGNTMCIAPTHRVHCMWTNTQLTPKQAIEVYQLRNTEDAAEVAGRFGISRNQVLAIWRGRNWADVTGAQYPGKQRRVTTPETAQAIRERYGHASAAAVAAEFGISRRTVNRIWADQNYRLPQEQAAC
ncbi:HNH endonuclease [Streptomyces phage Galactica]|nr:HNH endonuclease [Streptomyces phage Galactica]